MSERVADEDYTGEMFVRGEFFSKRPHLSDCLLQIGMSALALVQIVDFTRRTLNTLDVYAHLRPNMVIRLYSPA
jgi:hypothetical protein